MSNNKENKKLVPELRFSEFEEGWNEKELIDVTDKKIKWSFTGGPFGSNLKSSDYVTEEDGIRIIQLQNIGDGEFKNDYKIFTSEEKADELISNNIYPGEIIMSKMGDPVGRACLIPDFHDRYVMASDGIRVVVDENKFDKYFIYTLINSSLFRTKIENSSTGSTRKRIGLSILKKLTFNVPMSKAEQHKIAHTLTTLDELIATEQEKKDALDAHKKGLLQQLFPAQGERMPKLRFGEFEGEWEEIELKEVIDKNIRWGFTGGPFGSNLKSSDYVQESNGVRIIQLQNIGDGEFKNDYKIFTSEEKADELISNNIYPGEIIMSKMGDPVGRACLIPDFHDRYVMASDGIRVVVDENKFNKYFIFSLINSKLFRTKIERSSTGSTRKRIKLSVLKKLSFIIPKDKTEQQKIAHCLSSLDDLIDTQSEKIEALQTHKKGLMQGLFP